MYGTTQNLLNREARNLMDACFWSSGHYWTTRQPKLKQDRRKTKIKSAYSVKTGWFFFIFSKFHATAIEVFRSLERGEVWFYTEPVNQFMSFSAWCIDAKHFESVLEQLRSLDDVHMEFVIQKSKQGLCVPEPFKEMGLEFFEVGKPCWRPRISLFYHFKQRKRWVVSLANAPVDKQIDSSYRWDAQIQFQVRQWGIPLTTVWASWNKSTVESPSADCSADFSIRFGCATRRASSNCWCASGHEWLKASANKLTMRNALITSSHHFWICS